MPNKKFFKARISKMGRKRMINVPKMECNFLEGKVVIVYLEEE